MQSSINSNSSVTSSLDKGFVPKTIVNNKDRYYQKYKSSRSNDDSDEEQQQWIKAPTKFLEIESNSINNDKENNNISPSNWNNARPAREKEESYTHNNEKQSKIALSNGLSANQQQTNTLTNYDDDEESLGSENRSEDIETTESDINNTVTKGALESKLGSNLSIPDPLRDGIAYQRLSANNSMIRKSGRYSEKTSSTTETPTRTMADVYGIPSPAMRSFENNRMLSLQGQKESFVLTAPLRGSRTNLVHCTIRRDRNSLQGSLYPTYELILEETNKVIIIARKMELNRTSNYHLFDMTRGQAGSKLSKKNGNYLGKLRARNLQRTDYALLNQSSEKEELAGITFERLTLLEQLKEGNQPRKMKIILPKLDDDAVPIPNRVEENGSGSLLDILVGNTNRTSSNRVVHVLETKDPVFENGNYRLNFNGRVTKPSVKNFQMVSHEDIDDIICQFGKVEEDEFHLDYKTPLNAFQAFALALCQFNL